MELKVGLKYTSKTSVDTTNIADIVGSGDLPVFSTPSMIALMENAAMNVAKPFLAEDQTTVGVNVNVSHLAPSKKGNIVEATAELLQIEGRKLVFRIVAYQQDKLIGEGKHIRYIVDKEKFMK